MNSLHIPVLAHEILEILKISQAKKIIDATLGLGGHAKMILEQINLNKKEVRLLGIDQDIQNLDVARNNLEKSLENIILVKGNFSEIKKIAQENKFLQVDAILFDLGISSVHVDSAEKGFSFAKKGPLDMRFDRENNQETAADIINYSPLPKLIQIFRDYGQEKYAFKIAKKIVYRRKTQKFIDTIDLADTIINCCPKNFKNKIHPATKVFQALRIAVNNELEVLERGLKDAIELLAPEGRIVVISYHSLEDRIVKNIFRAGSRDCICSQEIIQCNCHHKADLKILTRKPITPSLKEIQENPRSRSAKLRAIEKI